MREDEAVTFLRSLGYTVERGPVTPPLPSIACDHCGKPIIIEQTQRYCSGACRVAAHRP